MTRGRKPKSTKRKALEGNRGKRRLKREPEPADGTASCPAYFGDDQRRVWFWLVGILPSFERTQSDALSLEVLVQAVVQFRQATQMLMTEGAVQETPNGFQQKSPWATVQKDAARTIDVYGSKFGLSPADRAKLATGDDQKKDDDDDVTPYTPKLSG